MFFFLFFFSFSSGRRHTRLCQVTGVQTCALPISIMASSVMTSHSVARLDYRVPLVAFTALHQAATASWLGGLPYLLIAIRRARTPDFARQLGARFSQLAV